jgi:hypothetical protein
MSSSAGFAWMKTRIQSSASCHPAFATRAIRWRRRRNVVGMRILRRFLPLAAGARQAAFSWSVGSLETGHHARTGTAATRCVDFFVAADLRQRLSQAVGLVAAARARPNQRREVDRQKIGTPKKLLVAEGSADERLAALLTAIVEAVVAATELMPALQRR